MSFEIRLANRYRLEKEIGSGGFGVVYEGTNIETKKKVAIKIEERDVKKPPKLEKEFELYEKLKGEEGFIEVETYVVGDFYNMLVMELLGASLGCLFNFVGKKFSLKTTLMIADQLLTRLEFIHSKGIVYRDVKPNNFVMGTGNREHIIYVVDYGLAKMFIDENKKHVPFEQQNFAGTAHYASLNAHLKRAQSRRDDLESLGYLLVYFIEGQLPWHGLKASSKRDRRKMIGISKLKTSIRELCKGLNNEFVTYFEYVRSLEYADKPDYGYLRRLFRHLFESKGYEYDGKFDWTLKKETYYPSYISPKLVIIPTKKKKSRQIERNKQVQIMRQLKDERDKQLDSDDSDDSDNNKKKKKKRRERTLYELSN